MSALRPHTFPIRRHKYFLLGCLIGILLSFLFMPLIEDCNQQRKNSDRSSTQQTSTEQLTLTTPEPDSEDYQLFVRLDQWYRNISKSDYEPTIRLGSSEKIDDAQDQPEKGNNARPPEVGGALIRDKKLKFYRPRFHLNELNVSKPLLICIYICEDYLQSASSVKFATTKEIVVDYINTATTGYLADYKDDLIFFYPEIKAYDDGDDVKFSYNNLIVVSQNAKTSELLSGQPTEVRHFHMLRYLHERGYFQTYAGVVMLTEQTMLNTVLLEQRLADQVTAADWILSTSNGRPNAEKNETIKYFQQHWSQDDVVLDFGLFISSSLVQQCGLDINCLQSQFQQEAAPNNINRHYWHPSCHFEDTKNISMLENCLTIFPVDSNEFHEVSSSLAVDYIKHLSVDIENTEADIVRVDVNQTISWPVGVIRQPKTHNRFEVIRWTYWNSSHAFMPNDLVVVRPLFASELAELDYVRQRLEAEVGKSVALLTIYRRFDSVRGLEYIIDARLNTLPPPPSSPMLRYQILRPLNALEVLNDVPYISENTQLTLVLPVRGSREVPLAIRFLKNYASICLAEPGHRTRLIITLVQARLTKTEHEHLENLIVNKEATEFERLKQVAAHIGSTYENAKINFIDIHAPSVVDNLDTELNRFPAEFTYFDLITRSLAASTTNEPVLLFHCRSNMLISLDLFDRIRLTTMAGRQVFAPIPFVEYRLRGHRIDTAAAASFWHDLNQNFSISDEFDVRKDDGYFDDTNYELIAFYLSDYQSMRAQLIENGIPMATSQQVISRNAAIYYNANLDLYHAFEQTSGLQRMRVVEPELQLFHSAILDQCKHFEANPYSMATCQHRQIFGFGPKQTVASVVQEGIRRIIATSKASADHKNSN